MLSADTEAWRVREGMNLFTDSRSEAAKWNITTWKRILLWRQGSEPGTSPVFNVHYILQSSKVGFYIIPIMQRRKWSIREVKELLQGHRVSGRGRILAPATVSLQSPGS